jgi:hypothetical protein
MSNKGIAAVQQNGLNHNTFTHLSQIAELIIQLLHAYGSKTARTQNLATFCFVHSALAQNF